MHSDARSSVAITCLVLSSPHPGSELGAMGEAGQGPWARLQGVDSSELLNQHAPAPHHVPSATHEEEDAVGQGWPGTAWPAMSGHKRPDTGTRTPVPPGPPPGPGPCQPFPSAAASCGCCPQCTDPLVTSPAKPLAFPGGTFVSLGVWLGHRPRPWVARFVLR